MGLHKVCACCGVPEHQDRTWRTLWHLVAGARPGSSLWTLWNQPRWLRWPMGAGILPGLRSRICHARDPEAIPLSYKWADMSAWLGLLSTFSLERSLARLLRC